MASSSTGGRNGWTAAYEDVEYDIPLLAGMDESNVNQRRSTERYTEDSSPEEQQRRRPVIDDGDNSPPLPSLPPSANITQASAPANVLERPPSLNVSLLGNLGLGLGEFDGMGDSEQREDGRNAEGRGASGNISQASGAAGPTTTPAITASTPQPTPSIPRTPSTKAFAPSPLSAPHTPTAGEGAPFLVLTSGSAAGASSGIALVDGPQTPPKPARYNSTHQPTTRASDVSSAASDAIPSSTSSGSGTSTALSASASGTALLASSSAATSPPHAPHNISGSPKSPGFSSPFARPGARPGATLLASTSGGSFMTASASAPARGSMILYRLSAGEDGVLAHSHTGGSLSGSASLSGITPPGLRSAHAPPAPAWHRSSAYSTDAADSVFLDGDTKYPSLSGTPRGSAFGLGPHSGQTTPMGLGGGVTLGMRAATPEMGTLGRVHGGLVAYVWDPDEEDEDDEDEGPVERWMHDPAGVNPLYASQGYGKAASLSGSPPSMEKGRVAGGRPAAAPYHPRRTVSLRGVVNVAALVALVVGLLCLFIVLPITKMFSDNGVAAKILGNTRINSTGQAVARRDVWEGWVFERDGV